MERKRVLEFGAELEDERVPDGEQWSRKMLAHGMLSALERSEDRWKVVE